jgi:ketosteroid isomerase-like protein
MEKNTMKKLTTIWLLIIASATITFAQSSTEKEILKFIADYDQAYLNKDISFAERVLADDYVFSGDDGKAKNRAESLAEARNDFADTTYKLVSLKSVNDAMHISGITVIVSGNWTSSVVSTSDLAAEPHIDRGRYTMAMEKKGGKWMVVVEHFSEAQHDRKLMEAGVLKASMAYDDAIIRRDKNAYEKLLYKDYIYTSADGKIATRAEDIAHVAMPGIVISTNETTDKKIQILGNSSAVETGQYHVIGTRDGKPFEETGRYTTTWIWRDFRWQVIADHNSLIKK